MDELYGRDGLEALLKSLETKETTQTTETPTEEPMQTDKKKKLADMSNDEKRAHYDNEISRLKARLKKAEEKRDRIGSVTEKQRNHALILFASHFITREKLAAWYQLPPKERDKAIREYALKLHRYLDNRGML